MLRGAAAVAALPASVGPPAALSLARADAGGGGQLSIGSAAEDEVPRGGFQGGLEEKNRFAFLAAKKLLGHDRH